MLYRILASLATLALLVACAPANSRPLVDVSVVDRDTGESLARHPHRGDLWVAGAPGHRYSVRLANTTGERVLVVLSVDGINAVTGQTADPSQAGYVLEPWQTTEIHGWRKSMDDWRSSCSPILATATPHVPGARATSASSGWRLSARRPHTATPTNRRRSPAGR